MKKNKKKRKHTGLIASLVLLGIAAVVAVGFYFYVAGQYEDHFFQGTVINGMDVSGLTVSEVEDRLRDGADRSYALTVSFRGGSTETITNDDIGYRYESDGSVQAFMDQQDPRHWIEGMLHPESKEVAIPMVYDEELLDQAIASLPELQAENMTAPENAYMDFQDNEFMIVPETQGTQLDAERAARLIREAVASHLESLDLETAAPDIYTAPSILSTDEKMNEEVRELNTFTGASITYDLPGGETQVLDGMVLKDWLIKNDDGTYSKDEALWNEHIGNYVAELAADVDTIGTEKYFPATGIGNILVYCWTYGYQVNQEEEIAQLTEELGSGAVVERRPIYNYYETSDPDVNNGWGNTYVEIDCSRQHLWAYENGEVAFETDIVSGAMTPTRATPSGAFMFEGKRSPATLTGRNADGRYLFHVFRQRSRRYP